MAKLSRCHTTLVTRLSPTGDYPAPSAGKPGDLLIWREGDLFVDGKRAAAVVQGELAKAVPDVRSKQALKITATIMGDWRAGNGNRRQLNLAGIPVGDVDKDGLLNTADAADGLGIAVCRQAKLLRQRRRNERGAGSCIQRKGKRPLAMNRHGQQHQRGPILPLHDLDVFRNPLTGCRVTRTID